LADDLRRFLNRFAILAKRAGLLTRTNKWVRRHPAVAALAACLSAALLTAGFFAYQAHLDRERLRAEQRQAAVDRAILEAMSGDTPAALQAIADAENKGAESGRLNMLRGLVEYHRGRPREAVVYLEQADQQLPASVAVKALLAQAYARSGRLDRQKEIHALLEQLEPKVPEDYLFLGYTQADREPARGLRTLDRAPARFRQSPIARLFRAIAQTSLAQETGKMEDAEQALEDFRKVDLPDQLLLLCNRVRACLVATHAYGPQDRRRRQAFTQAARDVDRLAQRRDNAMALQWRCYYYLVRGYDDALLAAAGQARTERVEATWVTHIEVSILYGRKKFEDALKVQESTHYAGGEGAPASQRGTVLAAMPGRKEEAEKLMTDGLRRTKSFLLCYDPAWLQLLGPEYRAKTRQAALVIRERSAHLIPAIRGRWYHHMLAFHAGSISAEELLKKAGESRSRQCEAYFYIGLAKLGEGNRGKAKTCFRRSMNTGMFINYEYFWSRAFLARVEDPEWLPWVKK
jgi:tetratricopeptide (TPR) repeat protein